MIYLYIGFDFLNNTKQVSLGLSFAITHYQVLLKYCLTQIRRAAYWSYRQASKIQFRLYFTNKNSPRFTQLTQQYQQALELHQQIMQAEQALCKSIKYIDLDSYIQDKLD